MGQGGEGGLHTCPTCGQTFGTQQELHTHMEQHEGETPETGADSIGE